MSRILAIDYGAKRIGLAISDEFAKLALPYETIENIGLRKAVENIKQIIEKEEITGIIIGLPKRLDGSYGNKEELDNFINKLKSSIQIPIDLIDERMTSKAADRFRLDKDSRQSGWRDKVAAAIFLQDYLDKLHASIL